MPPKSGLLPPEPDSFNHVIDKVITHLNLKLSQSSDNSTTHSLEEEVQSKLKNIKKRTSEEGYSKIVNTVMNLQPEENRLKFIEAIQRNLFEFNQVSLEENINKKVETGKKAWEPLENINLSDLLDKAKQEIKARLEKEQKLGLGKEKGSSQVNKETEVDKQANEEELAIGLRSSSFPPEVPDSPEGLSLITPTLDDLKPISEELNRAWVNGDSQKLRELLDKDFELNEEPPEIDEVHRSRDKDMADKIVEVVRQAKEEDTEATIMMGCAHLLYTKRKNILTYLTESSDLSGWSIRQIKKDDSLNS